MLKANLEKILTEVLNEGIEGSLIPNEYAKGKIAVALSQILKLLESVVGEKEPEFGGTHADVCIAIGRNMLRAEIKGRIK